MGQSAVGRTRIGAAAALFSRIAGWPLEITNKAEPVQVPFKYRGSGVQVVLLGKLLVDKLDHENYLLLIERSAPPGTISSRHRIVGAHPYRIFELMRSLRK